jgi:hypothetical protein
MATHTTHTKRTRHKDDEHDDETDRPRPRSRDYDDGGDVTVNPAQVVGNLSSLAYAWAQASTEIWVGTTRVLGNFVMNMNEQLFYGTRPGAARRSRHRDDLDEHDDAPRRRSVSQGIADNVNEALEESADVFARSADRFSQSYDSARHRAADDDVEEARAHRRKAEEDERHAKAKKRETDAEVRKDE